MSHVVRVIENAVRWAAPLINTAQGNRIGRNGPFEDEKAVNHAIGLRMAMLPRQKQFTVKD